MMAMFSIVPGVFMMKLRWNFTLACLKQRNVTSVLCQTSMLQPDTML